MMGYMGLENWNDSDGAADFRSVVMDAIADACEKEIKDEANFCNTSGWVNIALVVAEDLLKGADAIYSEGKMYKILQKAKKRLEKNIADVEKDSEEWRDKEMHIKAWKRMIESIGDILAAAY